MPLTLLAGRPPVCVGHGVTYPPAPGPGPFSSSRPTNLPQRRGCLRAKITRPQAQQAAAARTLTSPATRSLHRCLLGRITAGGPPTQPRPTGTAAPLPTAAPLQPPPVHHRRRRDQGPSSASSTSRALEPRQRPQAPPPTASSRRRSHTTSAHAPSQDGPASGGHGGGGAAARQGVGSGRPGS